MAMKMGGGKPKMPMMAGKMPMMMGKGGGRLKPPGRKAFGAKKLGQLGHAVVEKRPKPDGTY